MEEALQTIFSKFKGKREEIIPILQKVQESYSFLPEDSMKEIARFTRVPESDIYGVATFYAQFRMTPVGEHLVKVCHGTACHVGGATNLTEALEGELGIKSGETTADMKLTVDGVACVGCCSLAPVVMIDNATFGRLDRKKVVKLIQDYK